MPNRSPRREKIKAVILAAGYATRLYPLTLGIPKPLLRITARKTVVDFIVDSLAESGRVSEIFVVTNSKFSREFETWTRGQKYRSMISVLDDGTRSNEDRLGAIGDIDYAVRKKDIRDDVVVVGGDNLFGRPVDSFLSFAEQKAPYASLGLYDIRDKKTASRFGIVSKDSRGRLTHFEEKPKSPRTTLAATCLYYFPAETLPLLKSYARDATTSNDASGNYIRWLMERQEVYGFPLRQGHWFDIGHLDLYKEVVAKYNGPLQ